MAFAHGRGNVFQFEPSLQQLAAKPGQLLALAESSNQPNVHVPGRQAQAAQAFVAAIQTSPDTCSIFVYLWLTQSRAPAIFAHERRHLPLASLEAAEDEAWHFCESMGFMLDRIALGRPRRRAGRPGFAGGARAARPPPRQLLKVSG